MMKQINKETFHDINLTFSPDTEIIKLVEVADQNYL
jgi:hypothetical protein